MLAKVFGFEVPYLICGSAAKPYVFKITDHPQVGDFISGKILHIVLQLRKGFIKTLAAALHLNSNFAFPNIIYIASSAAGKRNPILKISNSHRLVYTKDTQKIKLETLRFRFFIFGFLPFL
ncbi:MAG: hypothetical protein FWE20_00645 [Defluviitaleaceae bacterium]|nr:hypothetical protein [Defluviitaleaceae bacterium]